MEPDACAWDKLDGNVRDTYVECVEDWMEAFGMSEALELEVPTVKALAQWVVSAYTSSCGWIQGSYSARGNVWPGVKS